jgi:hypothetical protein
MPERRSAACRTTGRRGLQTCGAAGVWSGHWLGHFQFNAFRKALPLLVVACVYLGLSCPALAADCSISFPTGTETPILENGGQRTLAFADEPNTPTDSCLGFGSIATITTPQASSKGIWTSTNNGPSFDNAIFYTPNPGASGIDTFIVNATNGTTSAAMTVAITVTITAVSPTITSITPSVGPTGGGTSVTITGTNFAGATAVTFGGVAATGVTVVSATSITAATPAHAVGTVDVAVTTPGGTGTGTGLYTYQAAPTVTAISPTSGPIAGGTSVTITGTNFTGATSVTIGGAPATGVAVVSATSITATTPTHAAGTVDVAVTTPGGIGTGPGLYTYIAAPTVTAISPTRGPTAGGTSVTITGTNLTGITSVTIGGVAATGVTVVSATSITATTAAHAAGTIDVVVTTNGGTGTGTALYTYASAPTVTAISPTSGPIAGGTSVAITGTNLTGATSVTIGGVAATGVAVVSATSITAITPAHAVGAVDVAVTTPGGTGTGTGLYTYSAAPTVTAISPNSGATAGGASVTITGTGLTGATSVTIGGVAATGVTVVSATSITATTPAHAAGATDVVVTTTGGTGTGTGLYTYFSAPTVTAISPHSGTTTGGTAVTITGTGLTGATSVTIGGVAATGVTVVGATSITATTPAHAVGAVDVVVTTPGGTGTGTGLYSYASIPSVTSISPTIGPTAGGTAVTVTGTNFTGATSVTIGGVVATGFAIVSATSITAITPPHAAGTVDVAVTTSAGTGVGTGLYIYAAVPTVTSVAPASGPVTGGASVTITGTNLTGATSVTIGGVAATGVTVASATSITATTPAHSAGTVNIAVTTPGGTGTGTGLYTYSAAPSVTAISPNSGTTAGGTSVTITGTSLTGATSVTIGGVAATGVTVVSATSITATTPVHAAGTVDVAVTTPSGAATGTSLYTYSSIPTVTSISPNSGTTVGGASVTITGANLTGATSVTFGGVAATGVTVNSATSITATTPAHAAGAVDVSVTAAGGTATGSGLYTYAMPATATVVVSSKNPSEVGQAVTFTATVSTSGGKPTGAVTFNDGGVSIGTATLAGGTAALTTSALKLGNHTITAVYAGNISFSASTSSPLLQSVSTPQDSLKLRALQLIATKMLAQNSGSAISGAIDTAISDGFGDGGDLVTPSDGGLRFNFSADPDRPHATTSESPITDRWNGTYTGSAANSGLPGSADRYAQLQSPRGRSGVDDAFAAIDRGAMPAKAPPLRYTEPKEWLFWADVTGAGINRSGSPTAASVLYGSQINALIGLTRRITPNFLVGAVGGYETFDYKSDTLSGRLKGDGWTVGSYLGWKFAPGLRFDAAAAYSGIGYDGSAGTASGDFNGHRWLVSGGLSGDTKVHGFDIEPSARVYALWENENAYTDSLGTPQAERSFFTGRASAGLKVSYPWLASATVALAPYAGLYADYYFTGDDAATVALAGAAPLASVPLLEGWSARVTGGMAARFANGAQVAIGAELGGIGGDVQIWTFRARGSIPF